MDDSSEALEAIAATAEFALEYTNAVSTVLVEAYLAQARLSADVMIDKRVELMRILLQGYDESDGRITNILRESGYLEGRRNYCLIVVRPVDRAEMLSAELARRLVDSQIKPWVVISITHLLISKISGSLRLFQMYTDFRLDETEGCTTRACFNPLA